ncbi:hypothetical protein [Hoeflea sp. AS16]|uniref:hypothetical protein n=1 Tax=Hoeflea sp. AS16 TaxID=3135779 RepID=UPI0031716D25
MVPSTVPSPAAPNNTKTSVQKTDSVAPSDAARTVSDRVTAFLSSDTATEKTTQRPNRPPPPPGGAGGSQGVRQGEATSESETALLLLEETEAEEDAEVDEDTETPTTAILFDEAKNYYPTSIY